MNYDNPETAACSVAPSNPLLETVMSGMGYYHNVTSDTLATLTTIAERLFGTTPHGAAGALKAVDPNGFQSIFVNSSEALTWRLNEIDNLAHRINAGL